MWAYGRIETLIAARFLTRSDPPPTHGCHPPERTRSGSSTAGTHDGAELVLEDRFSMVPEWVLDADIVDWALRLYAVLLRFGNTTGAPVLAGTRLHNSPRSAESTTSVATTTTNRGPASGTKRLGFVKLEPALRTEMFFETFFGLAMDGKTNSKGLPNLLSMAVIMQEYAEEMRLARPPARVQRALFAPLAILGRRLGYRGWYPEYTSQTDPETGRLVRMSAPPGDALPA